MGKAVSNSWMNCRRFCFRSTVPARAAPCASSVNVTTDKAISVSAVVRAMAASICRAFWPCRSAAISTLESWNRGSVPCGRFKRLAVALDGGFYILGEVRIHDRCRVLWQKRDALGDGAARRDRRMDHRHRQLVALDHDLRTGAHAR